MSSVSAAPCALQHLSDLLPIKSLHPRLESDPVVVGIHAAHLYLPKLWNTFHAHDDASNSYLICAITILKAVRIRQKLQRRCSSNCGVSNTSICSWCISPSLWHTSIQTIAIRLNGGGLTRSRSTSVCNKLQLCAAVMLICGVRKHAIPGDVACHGRAGRRRTSKEHRR